MGMLDKIKELRERTGVGMMDCKKALEESNGDVDKAIEYLRKMGIAKAQKRAGRIASEGLINAYIHGGGKLGVLVEVNCETDFVAKTEEFKKFVREISMQIAATNPICIDKEDLPKDIIEKEREIYHQQALRSGKPEKVISNIVEGRLKKFYQQACLLEQPYIRDSKLKIRDLLNEIITKTGENIVIRRFVRFELGEKTSHEVNLQKNTA
ncbi:MAG: translation elongation factor Ts [Deltaproteobacteria bacterium]|nr:translation elongation factor Ts [Deltaproteobacteria bacterium]MDL1971944.1 translation elongation factor Ts [Deltaproteobacteria bacterium]